MIAEAIERQGSQKLTMTLHSFFFWVLMRVEPRTSWDVFQFPTMGGVEREK